MFTICRGTNISYSSNVQNSEYAAEFHQSGRTSRKTVHLEMHSSILDKDTFYFDWRFFSPPP